MTSLPTAPADPPTNHHILGHGLGHGLVAAAGDPTGHTYQA
ncbi:hypothetical protein [Brachybacterium sp. FME24]|nr:hypothetical protein [Brachybacterium sp. FME24]